MALNVPDINGNFTLVIAINGTTSDVVNLTGRVDLKGLLVIAPAALTGTCTVQVSNDNVTYAALQSPAGTDLTVAAAKAIVISPIVGCFVRIVSGSAEGAARTWTLRRV